MNRFNNHNKKLLRTIEI